MKLLLTACCLLMATTAQADTCREQYERRDRLKTYISDPVAYARCIEDVARRKLEGELIKSQIELNKQKAEWYRRHRNNLNYRGFPCEEVKNGR